MTSVDIRSVEAPALAVTTLAMDSVKNAPTLGNLDYDVLSVRQTVDPLDPDENRFHYYVGMQIDSFEHTGWYTQALADHDTGATIVNKAGWGEIVNDGVGWELHKRLSAFLPGVDVFSHETEGVGRFAPNMSARELLDHGVDQMALHGLELLVRFCQDRRVVTVGTSMASVIFNRLLNLNLDQGEPVNIAGVVDYAPALVDPKNVAHDMALRFFPELLLDTAQELIFRTEPRRLLSLLKQFVASRPKASNLLPMARQGIDLLHGTPETEIERVVAHYPTAVIVGTRDAVGQLPMWQRLADNHSSLTLHPVKNRGHAMAFKPYEGARKISNTTIERGLLAA